MEEDSAPERADVRRPRLVVATLIFIVCVVALGGVLALHRPPPVGGSPPVAPSSGSTVSQGLGTCPAEFQHPPITHATALRDLAMVSPTEGWAVGGNGGFGGSVTQSALLHLVNGQWVTDHDIAGATSIDAISMTSPSDGWLVYTTPQETQATTSNTLFHLAHYDGQRWRPSLADLSLYGDTNVYALTLRMRTATDGWLMPVQLQTTGNAVLLHYDGTAWQRVVTPFISTDRVFYQFNSLAPVAPNELWVAGNYTDDSGGATSGQYIVLAHYQDGRWTTDTQLRSRPGSLQQIVMFSPSDGWVAGQEGNSSVSLYHYDGQSWMHVTTPAWVTAQTSLAGIFAGLDGDLWAGVATAIPPNRSVWTERPSAIKRFVNGQWQDVAPIPFPSSDDLLGFTLAQIVPLSQDDIWLLGNLGYQRSCPPLATTDLGRGVILHYLNGQWTQVIMPAA